MIIKDYMEEIRGEYFYISNKNIQELLNHDFNRPLVTSHVAKIEKALKEDCSYFVQQLLVGIKDGNYVLADGHHRKQAAINLAKKGIYTDSKGNPIKLRVQFLGEDIDFEKVMLTVNNTSLSWTLLNFIQLNAFKGNTSCVNFLNFMENTGINTVSAALAYFGRSSLTKAQAEQFDRFPLITESDVKKAAFFKDIVEILDNKTKAAIARSFNFKSSTGIKNFVNYFTLNYTAEDIINFVSWLVGTTIPTYQDYYNKFGTTAYYRGFYEYISNEYKNNK